MKYLIILSFIFPIHSYAKREGNLNDKKRPISAVIGLEFISQKIRRGRILEDSNSSPFIFPYAVKFNFISPHLEMIGKSLNYKKNLTDKLLFRTHFQSLKYNNKHTYEWNHYLEYKLSGGGEVTFQHSQDFKSHQGQYLDFKIRKEVFSFYVRQHNLKLSFFTSIGGGDTSHNKFLYGEKKGGFFTNYSYGLSLITPKIDHFYPVFELKRYGTYGDKQTQLKHKTSGWRFIALMAFQVF